MSQWWNWDCLLTECHVNQFICQEFCSSSLSLLWFSQSPLAAKPTGGDHIENWPKSKEHFYHFEATWSCEPTSPCWSPFLYSSARHQLTLQTTDTETRLTLLFLRAARVEISSRSEQKIYCYDLLAPPTYCSRLSRKQRLWQKDDGSSKHL